ncbi:hypothetical protein [Streptomyces sp. NPDC052693]|uniref:hypothetical protein n=1 Tax=Streptomyces sp. NPDC052693 TaxID=3155814 RepID=UPI003421BD1F
MDVVSILEALAEQGVTALVTADGERMLERSLPWTFVANGEPLGGQVVRVDAASVEACRTAAIPRLRALGMSAPE